MSVALTDFPIVLKRAISHCSYAGSKMKSDTLFFFCARAIELPDYYRHIAAERNDALRNFNSF